MPAENKNILYLSYDGLTDPLGQSQILPYLTGLSRKEHKICIISFEKPDRFKQNKAFVEKLCMENELEWFPLTYHKKPPVLSTIYDGWMLKLKSKELHRQHKFKIIHCRSYIASLVGCWMKRKYDIKFIFDIRGFWADERIESSLWSLTNPLHRLIYNFFKEKEKQFLQEADHIVALTENSKNQIVEWKVTSSPVTVIPTCVDIDFFNPDRITISQKENLSSALKIHADDFVLLYLGSIGTWYLIKEMLNFFSALKELRSNARFLIVSPDEVDLTEFRHREDVIVKKASRLEVPLYISLANASIFFIKPSFSKIASSATKMAEIMAMGIPVVTNRGWGDIAKYEKLLTGFEVISNPGDYNNVALKLINHKYDLSLIREEASKYFSLAQGIILYDRIYKDLL